MAASELGRQVLSPDVGLSGDESRLHSGNGLRANGAAAAIRVLVADGSPSIRSDVRLTLEIAGCSVCAEASDVAAAVQAALRERPDVCLIDMDLPGGAIAAVAAIADEVPDTSVVMFGDQAGEAGFLAALQAGACGYLCKDIDALRLATTLRGVRAGEAALSRTLVASLINAFRAQSRRGHLSLSCHLTNREVEVLELLCEGLKTAEIADRLFVARVTVRTHIASILRKLNVPDRQAAIRRLNGH